MSRDLPDGTIDKREGPASTGVERALFERSGAQALPCIHFFSMGVMAMRRSAGPMLLTMRKP